MEIFQRFSGELPPSKTKQDKRSFLTHILLKRSTISDRRRRRPKRRRRSSGQPNFVLFKEKKKEKHHQIWRFHFFPLPLASKCFFFVLFFVVAKVAMIQQNV